MDVFHQYLKTCLSQIQVHDLIYLFPLNPSWDWEMFVTNHWLPLLERLNQYFRCDWVVRTGIQWISSINFHIMDWCLRLSVDKQVNSRC